LFDKHRLQALILKQSLILHIRISFLNNIQIFICVSDRPLAGRCICECLLTNDILRSHASFLDFKQGQWTILLKAEWL
jgi:hypothetical protein